MSTEHDVIVHRVGAIKPHENADTLSITEVDGRPCIIRTGEFQTGDLAVYVPIDSLVPTTAPRFAFLAPKARSDGFARIRAVKLRGVFSMGLLVKPGPDMVEGDEVRDRMGIEVYEAPEYTGHGQGGKFSSSRAEKDPGFLPVYDVESARKYRHLLLDGEEIVITEKVHGANARFAFHHGRLWVASRNQFKLCDESDLWWGLARRYQLEEKLAECPGLAIYGEAYGQVQDLKYGLDDHRLVLFDALDIDRGVYSDSFGWLDYPGLLTIAEHLDIPTAPQLYRGPWSADRWEAFKSLAEGPTVIGNGAHVREGWVLRPVKERQDRRLGRVIMKLHGEGFNLRKGG